MSQAETIAEAVRNRIVGYADVAPDQLLANPWNYRYHQQYQREALTGVLREVGYVQDVIENKRTGHLVDGHLRVSIALNENEATVPVKYIDVDEREELGILALKDPIAAMVESDASNLGELVRTGAPKSDAMKMAMAELCDRYFTGDTLPPQPTDAAHVTHPYEGRAPTDEQRAAGEVRTPLKVIYLFMTQRTYDQTLRSLRKLSESFGTDTLVATTVEALRREAEKARSA